MGADFCIEIVGSDGHRTVSVVGEIDAATAERLWENIELALAGSDRLVLDLRATTFMDSSGLAVLVRAHRRLGQCSEAVVVRAPSGAVRRALRLSGIDKVVTVEDIEDEHLTADRS